MGKVEIQKGKIQADQKTSKSMTREEKVQEAKEQNKALRDGQTLKSSKK